MVVYTARHVVPVSAPAIQDGALAIEAGKISRVGARAAVLDDLPPGTEVRDLGDSVLLPGLVNAHTHLELSWATDAATRASGDFMTWLRDLVELRDEEDERRSIGAASRAIEYLVARGTVAIGDIANRTWTVPLLARSALHAVVFHELFGFRSSAASSLLDAGEARLAAVSESTSGTTTNDRVRASLTPHAPHTCSPELLSALSRRAERNGEPLSVHVAESRAEVELLRDGGGALPEFYRERGVWDDRYRAPGVSPIEHLDRLGALSKRTLAVHCVQLDDLDIERIRERGATVVTCPRSNRCLGVGTAPIPRLIEAGVPLALGTDSLASAPDIDLFAEIRALVEEHPSLRPEHAVRIATLGGATALGLADRLGSLAPGKLGVAAVVRMTDPRDTPHELLCSCPEQATSLEQASWDGGTS